MSCGKRRCSRISNRLFDVDVDVDDDVDVIEGGVVDNVTDDDDDEDEDDDEDGGIISNDDDVSEFDVDWCTLLADVLDVAVDGVVEIIDVVAVVVDDDEEESAFRSTCGKLNFLFQKVIQH